MISRPQSSIGECSILACATSKGIYSSLLFVRPLIISQSTSIFSYRTTTDNTEKYYSFGKRGTVPQAGRMSWPALEVLDKRAGWDWSKYDLDGNGVIDSLVIIHSGYGAETTTDDCFGAEFNNRIWAHAFSTSRAHAWNSEDGSIRVGGYTMASAFDGDCGTVPMKIGLTGMCGKFLIRPNRWGVLPCF